MKVKIFPIVSKINRNKWIRKYCSKRVNNKTINIRKVNNVLYRQSREYELVKYNLFGDDFDNYVDVKLNGIIYKTKKK